MRSDTVAKLLYDLRYRPTGFEPPVAGTTIVIDEAGMLNTADLHQLINHTDNFGWRLALVGDPRQLHAVGRGGMFDELCATGLTIELDQLHRFTHDWEAAATLRLRRGDASVLNTYADHKAIIAGTFDDHLAGVVNEWRWHQTMGTTLAITTTRNDDVRTINDAIQVDRLERGDLDTAPATLLSIGIGHPGDVITTRRNDRRLLTTTGDSVRNRDHLTINAINPDGALVATSLNGDRTVTLPADYVAEHVHLGCAATEHGAQGETADASLTIITDATTNRGLYVGTTRGQSNNLILTVADDIAHAIERLTHAITNDRTDLPATVQRRHLLQDQKRLRPTRKPRCEIPDWFNGVFEEARADAHRLRRAAETRDAQREKESQLVDEARRLLPGATAAHAPFADAVRHSSYERHNAQKNVWPVEGDLRSAGRFGRRSARQRLEEVTEALALANEHHIRVSERAQPTKKRLDRLEQIVYSWEDQASTRQILDEWYNLDRQARVAEIRVEALDTWHRWASGSSLGEGERHLLATETTARIDPKIARLFELATPAPTIEAPRPATPAPAVDLRLP